MATFQTMKIENDLEVGFWLQNFHFGSENEFGWIYGKMNIILYHVFTSKSIYHYQMIVLFDCVFFFT